MSSTAATDLRRRSQVAEAECAAEEEALRAATTQDRAKLDDLVKQSMKLIEEMRKIMEDLDMDSVYQNGAGAAEQVERHARKEDLAVTEGELDLVVVTWRRFACMSCEMKQSDDLIKETAAEARITM